MCINQEKDAEMGEDMDDSNESFRDSNTIERLERWGLWRNGEKAMKTGFREENNTSAIRCSGSDCNYRARQSLLPIEPAGVS